MATVVETTVPERKDFVQTMVVIGATILLFLGFTGLRSIVAALPAFYLIIERRVKHRSWADVGFQLRNTRSDVKANWLLIFLVGIASPFVTLYLGRLAVPGFVDHVASRLPMDVHVISQAVVVATVGTFLEEIIFRGFIQERLSWFLGLPFAIGITSLLFALMHFSSGSSGVVLFDLGGIFIDGILFGLIYARTKNIFASWIGHYLSDLIAIACFLFLV